MIAHRLTIGFALVAVGAGAGGSGASTQAVPGSGAVVVVSSGWGQQSEGRSGFYSWGVVLANRSTTEDALGVAVTVSLYTGELAYERRMRIEYTLRDGRISRCDVTPLPEYPLA